MSDRVSVSSHLSSLSLYLDCTITDRAVFHEARHTCIWLELGVGVSIEWLAIDRQCLCSLELVVSHLHEGKY
jgi:hypothetical protein